MWGAIISGAVWMLSDGTDYGFTAGTKWYDRCPLHLRCPWERGRPPDGSNTRFISSGSHPISRRQVPGQHWHRQIGLRSPRFRTRAPPTGGLSWWITCKGASLPVKMFSTPQAQHAIRQTTGAGELDYSPAPW